MKYIYLALIAALISGASYTIGVHRGARASLVDTASINALIMADLVENLGENKEQIRLRVIGELRRQIFLFDTGSSLNARSAEYFVPEFALTATSFRPKPIMRIQAISHAREVERSLAEAN